MNKIIGLYFLINFCANITFGQKSFFDSLSNAAIKLTEQQVTYDPTYFTIKYPNGDVPSNKGVCTDVVIRAYRKLNIDLQTEVHMDMKNNFSKYPKIKEFSNRIIPQPNPTLLTNQDIKLGVYTRYFCKKNNELKYIEIDKTTFEKLNSKSKDIAWDLYTPISTLWYIRGDADSYKANKGLISLIEST